MGTTAEIFYPHSVDWDGTDPTGGDVRTCETALPAAGANSSCVFGTTGTKTITVDPFTDLRATEGLDSAFGWAIDIAGTDGMDSTATAKRVVPSGTWLVQGELHSNLAALNACTVGFYVYRVAASPSTTRTLLFSSSFDAGLVITTGTIFSWTTASQDEIVLEANETIQFTFTLTCTGQIGTLWISYDTGDNTLSDCLVDVPTPGIRTRHLETVTVSGVATAARQGSTASVVVPAASAVGTAAMARVTTAARSISVDGVGTAARSLATTLNDISTVGVGTVAVERVTSAARSVLVTGVGTVERTSVVGLPIPAVSAVGTAAMARETVAARAVVVDAVGTAAMERVAQFARSITVTAVATVAGQVQIPFGLIPDTSDFVGSSPTFSITGRALTSAGAPISGAIVKLFRQSDDVKVASTTSAADGTYSFTRDTADPNTYYVLGFEDGANPQTHGVSDRDIAPS